MWWQGLCRQAEPARGPMAGGYRGDACREAEVLPGCIPNGIRSASLSQPVGEEHRRGTFSYLATISAFSWAIKDSMSFFMSEAVRHKKKEGKGVK